MTEKETQEIIVRVAFTPRLARWVLPVFFCLAFPNSAGTSDDSLMTNYVPSPAGVYSQLTVLGPDPSATQWSVQLPAAASLAPLNSTSNRVGIGTSNPDAGARLHLAGNLKVSGCIILRNTKRCYWEPE
jgi:hypothetical protein